MARAITGGACDLSAASALVLQWAGRQSYPAADSLGYFNSLDLSSGDKLHQQCAEIWPGYGEVIRNRKWCISAICDRILSKPDAPNQVAILGAGLSPLSLELHLRRPQLAIYDIDRFGMDAKCKHLGSLQCCDMSQIHFVPADITDTENLHSRLVTAGWNPAESTLVIMEGLSYFLDSEAIGKSFSIFGNSGKSLAIIDYLIHPGNVHFSRRNVPYEIFSVISRHFDFSSVHTYSCSSLANTIGADLLEYWTLYDIELARYGQGRQFPSADMGWSEVGVYSLSDIEDMQ